MVAAILNHKALAARVWKSAVCVCRTEVYKRAVGHVVSMVFCERSMSDRSSHGHGNPGKRNHGYEAHHSKLCHGNCPHCYTDVSTTCKSVRTITEDNRKQQTHAVQNLTNHTRCHECSNVCIRSPPKTPPTNYAL